MNIPSYDELSERQQRVVDSNRRTLVLGARQTGRTSTLLHRYHRSDRSNKALIVGTHPVKRQIIKQFSNHFGYGPTILTKHKSTRHYDALFIDNIGMTDIAGPTERIVCATATMNIQQALLSEFNTVTFFRHSDNPELDAQLLDETFRTTDRFDALETPSGNTVVGTELDRFVYDEENGQMIALPNDALLAVAAADCYDGNSHA